MIIAPCVFARVHPDAAAFLDQFDGQSAFLSVLADAGAELITAKRPTPFERFFFREPNGYVFEVIDRDGYEAE